jgi:hypothetical protein
MNRIISAATLAIALLTGTAQAADVGVSINISQPGVYGRVDIGQFPQPVLIAPRPIIVTHAPRVHEPVYLWVPTNHRQNWRRYCGRYDACGAPVYFVQDRWYQQRVMAPYYAQHRRDRGDRYDDRRGRGDDRHDRRNDRHDRNDRQDKDDKRGRGHGRD